MYMLGKIDMYYVRLGKHLASARSIDDKLIFLGGEMGGGGRKRRCEAKATTTKKRRKNSITSQTWTAKWSCGCVKRRAPVDEAPKILKIDFPLDALNAGVCRSKTGVHR